MARWAPFLTFVLAAWPATAQPFQGQVGTPDQALLGEDWYLLTPSEMPSIPLEGVTVSVLDCEENCPAPVRTDAAGGFSFPQLVAESAHLHFEPPACPGNDPECEPLEPREEVLENGGRTVLGAKWPAGVEDTVLRYMPLIAGAVYIKWRGEIPGALGTCARAGTWAIPINEECRSEAFNEYQIFVHEIVHLYERRLRRVCWYQAMEIDGWILRESWLRALEADREENGLGWIGEYPTEGLDVSAIARESLARFADVYFMPESLISESPWYGIRHPSCEPWPCYAMTYRELEQYAPNRYAFFERLVFARYLDRKSWERAHPHSPEDWPGMCEPFPPSLGWALDRLPPLPGSSKAHGGASITKGYLPEPPPTECSFSAFH